MPTVHILDENGYRATGDLAAVPDLLARGAKLWIDADGNQGVHDFLCGALKLHPLAVEDILQDRPAPKIEDYGDYLYLVVHGVIRDKATPELFETIELDLVLTEQWVFTHHTIPMRSIEAVSAELQRNPRALQRGTAFLAHALLDEMVDHYLPVIDAFDDDIDEVEAHVLQRPTPEVLQRIFRLKRSLHHLRRIALPQREVLLRVSRGEFDEIPEKALPFFRDIHDHFVRVADLADGYREILSGALEAYLSVQSNRMNEIMKALTLVATVFLPLTFLAGIWGMNFEVMPEIKWPFGYLFAWGIMVATALGMVIWFRTKKWI